MQTPTTAKRIMTDLEAHSKIGYLTFLKKREGERNLLFIYFGIKKCACLFSAHQSIDLIHVW